MLRFWQFCRGLITDEAHSLCIYSSDSAFIYLHSPLIISVVKLCALCMPMSVFVAVLVCCEVGRVFEQGKGEQQEEYPHMDEFVKENSSDCGTRQYFKGALESSQRNWRCTVMTICSLPSNSELKPQVKLFTANSLPVLGAIESISGFCAVSSCKISWPCLSFGLRMPTYSVEDQTCETPAIVLLYDLM